MQHPSSSPGPLGGSSHGHRRRLKYPSQDILDCCWFLFQQRYLSTISAKSWLPPAVGYGGLHDLAQPIFRPSRLPAECCSQSINVWVQTDSLRFGSIRLATRFGSCKVCLRSRVVMHVARQTFSSYFGLNQVQRAAEVLPFVLEMATLPEGLSMGSSGALR